MAELFARDRRRAYAVTATVAVLSLLPLVRGIDDFPLSTYPMFSTRRPATAWINRASFSSANPGAGELVPLSPELVAGSDEPMQAVSTLGAAFHGGPRVAAALCREIAARAAAEGELGPGWIVLDRAQFSVLGYFEGQRAHATKLEARCPVKAR